LGFHPAFTGTVSYEYDSLRRLTHAGYDGFANNRQTDYQYDGVGNRTLLDGQNPERDISYTYGYETTSQSDDPNMLVKFTDNIEEKDVLFTYDANGNREEKEDCPNQYNFTWDIENRLTAFGVTACSGPGGSGGITYAIPVIKYDDDGKRIKRRKWPEDPIQYLYDDLDVIMIMDKEDEALSRFVYKDGLIIGRNNGDIQYTEGEVSGTQIDDRWATYDENSEFNEFDAWENLSNEPCNIVDVTLKVTYEDAVICRLPNIICLDEQDGERGFKIYYCLDNGLGEPNENWIEAVDTIVTHELNGETVEYTFWNVFEDLEQQQHIHIRVDHDHYSHDYPQGDLYDPFNCDDCNGDLVDEILNIELFKIKYIRIEESNEMAYFHHDAQGTVYGITDNQKAVKKSYQYDEFGNLLGSQGTDTNKFTYTGQEYEGNIFNCYYYPRWPPENPPPVAGSKSPRRET
jgi:hypothetical protein